MSAWSEIQHWYETADRSPQSWVELDRIMEREMAEFSDETKFALELAKRDCEKRMVERDDYLEMLMRYMARHAARKQEPDPAISWWQVFCREYPAEAADLERWLEERHDEECLISEDGSEDRAGSPRDE